MQFIPDDRFGYVRCLYQIIIPCGHDIPSRILMKGTTQFVDIDSSEQEVLFNIGSLFRIKYIGQSTKELSYVPIILELYTDAYGFESTFRTLKLTR
jgi:hypothetical protein